MGCCQRSHTSSVVSLAMSQMVQLLSQSVTTLTVVTKTQLQSALLPRQHNLCRNCSYREKGHTAGLTPPRCSIADPDVEMVQPPLATFWWLETTGIQQSSPKWVHLGSVCVHVWGRGTACSHTPASSWGLGCDDLLTLKSHTFMPFFPKQAFWNETRVFLFFSLVMAKTWSQDPKSNPLNCLFIQITGDSNCRLSCNTEHATCLFQMYSSNLYSE